MIESLIILILFIIVLVIPFLFSKSIMQILTGLLFLFFIFMFINMYHKIIYDQTIVERYLKLEFVGI